MQLLASITFGQVLLTVLEIALLATWIWSQSASSWTSTAAPI